MPSTVQLAKLANTHVTATCGARNIEFVKSLGADEAIDYRTLEGAVLTSPSGKKYDYVVHGARGIPWSTLEPNLATKARVVELNVGPSSFWTYFVNKITFPTKQLVPLIALQVKAENLEYMVNLVKEKKFKTIVDSRFPLSKAEAWEKMASGHATGKIIVEP